MDAYVLTVVKSLTHHEQRGGRCGGKQRRICIRALSLNNGNLSRTQRRIACRVAEFARHGLTCAAGIARRLIFGRMSCERHSTILRR